MAAARQLWSLGRAATRSYASAAASAEVTKAPIKVFGIEGRYAHALFSAASKKKAIDKVESELGDFQQMLTKYTELAEFMGNPTLDKRKKQSALGNVLKDKKYSDLTVNLFSTLAENNRLTKAQGVIKAYQTIMCAYRGEVPCTVTTAKALTDKNRQELEKSLKQFIDKDQVLKLEVKLDPSIIGGMVVDLGDKFIDMSTRTRIARIMKTLKEGL